MGESDKTKEYPTTTASSGGLYGSSTTNAGGTTYNPTDFEKNLVGSAQNGINTNFNNLMTGSYSNPDFQKYKSDLQTQQQNGFENNVVNPLISRGLLGTNGVQNLSNMYANTMNQQDSDLLDKFRNQTLQNLNTAGSMYSLPYDMYKGTTGLSSGLANNVANYNLANSQMKNAQNNSMFGMLGNGIGTAGSLLGSLGGAGAAAGGEVAGEAALTYAPELAMMLV